MASSSTDPPPPPPPPSPLPSESLFYQTYEDVWGVERWPRLYQALKAPTRHVARVNGFLYEPDRVRTSLEALPGVHCLTPSPSPSPGEEVTAGDDCARPLCCYECTTPAGSFPPPQTIHDPKGVRDYYLMDLASVVAAMALHVQPGMKVADFCAAPGGKSLVLAEMLGGAGSLVCNDRSSDRKGRLMRTIRDYVPERCRGAITVTCRDAAKWYQSDPQSYDRILVDAPCSSERHLLQPGGEAFLHQWGPQRSKRLATEQRALLSSAIRCLKPGGRVVYSTCSISPLENDGVVSKILKRNAHTIELADEEDFPSDFLTFFKRALPGAERTECGWMILPDRNQGWGPIYFSVLYRP